ncbi:Uncharacterised protein [Bordetella ansorpii]|uniref:Uncharacterized protein n=1 Tax=Bordetella ansorpii TaxID=288768 RepID=A0A157RMC3_9BORD|nr:hypothetical protein [Bordetella ansorpii]SAI59016.1 Uncharacterised protein [Bordetella ansorpii]
MQPNQALDVRPTPVFAPVPRRLVSSAQIAACATYREVVRLAWRCRARPGLTQAMLAAACDLHAQHVSSYLHEDEMFPNGSRRLELPPSRIAAFEQVVGNHAVTQWLVRQACLTLVEQMLAERSVPDVRQAA